MRHLAAFVLSEGARYQQLQLASADLAPRGIPGALDDGLEGWGFLMRTPDRGFALAYFEKGAPPPRMRGFLPHTNYRFTAFDPRTGAWARARIVRSDAVGALSLPVPKPGSGEDFAAKLLAVP
jgi:hypothetical protein